MTIKPYKQEVIDGLGDKLKDNAVAFTCLLGKSDIPSADTVKAVAAFKEGRNFDLYYIQSILASVGPNKNDDWFLPEEVWAARQTPVHKQLNYMHDEKNIIGVITDSVVLNSVGEYITSDSDISNIVDIATQAVIWTHWDDKKLENAVAKIINSIEANKLYVSMEALFKKFDYMLVKGDVTKVIPRNEQTAFLTKHLRFYGGSGEFDGGKLYRVLREFTFSGKGIVSDPANPRSVIDDLFDPEEVEAQANNNKNETKTISTKAESIMDEELKKEVAELKNALADANKVIASFKNQEAEKVNAEVNDLKAQVTALKTLAEETKAKMEDMEKDCAEKMAKTEEEAKAKVDEAEAKLATVVAEKIVAERISKLTALNVPEDKAKEVVKTFASVNDEMFTQIAALHAVKAEAPKTETTVTEAVESAQASVKTETPNVEVEQKTDDRIEALSKSLATKLNLTKNKDNKGKK